MPEKTSCIGAGQIVAPAASTALPSIPTYATWALIKPRTQGIYLRLAGGAATAADMLIGADVPVEVTSNLADVRVLQAAASSTVDVWYFG